MSRGFVKESDQEEAPFIPPRAPLPPGTPNYVTPRGLAALREELDALDAAVARHADATDPEGRRAWGTALGKRALLADRIATARPLTPGDVNTDEVRFGAYATYRIGGGKPVTVQIVGVDEADVKRRRLSFLAPLARALTGLRPGGSATLDVGGESRPIELVAVRYDVPAAATP